MDFTAVAHYGIGRDPTIRSHRSGVIIAKVIDREDFDAYLTTFEYIIDCNLVTIGEPDHLRHGNLPRKDVHSLLVSSHILP